MKIEANTSQPRNEILEKACEETTSEQSPDERVTDFLREPVSPLAAEETKKDLNGLRKTLLEILDECEQIASDNDMTTDQLFHYLNKKGLDLHEMATKENYLQSKALKAERFKLSDEKRIRLQELVKKAQSYKFWDRLANVTTIGVNTAAAVGTKDPIAIALALFSLGTFLDDEMGRPVKKGLFFFIEEEKSNQWAGYLNLVFEVVSCIKTGHSLGASSTLMGTAKIASAASQGVTAWKEHELSQEKGGLMQHKEDLRKLNETLKLKAEELRKIYQALTSTRESQLHMNKLNSDLGRIVQRSR